MLEISDDDCLQAITAQDEQINLEWKSEKLYDKGKEYFFGKLAIAAMSMANREGGLIVIGIAKEPGHEKESKGISDPKILQLFDPTRIHQAIGKYCEPDLELVQRTFEYENNKYGIIRVFRYTKSPHITIKECRPPNSKLLFNRGEIFIRTDRKESKRATPETLGQLIEAAVKEKFQADYPKYLGDLLQHIKGAINEQVQVTLAEYFEKPPHPRVDLVPDFPQPGDLIKNDYPAYLSIMIKPTQKLDILYNDLLDEIEAGIVRDKLGDAWFPQLTSINGLKQNFNIGFLWFSEFEFSQWKYDYSSIQIDGLVFTQSNVRQVSVWQVDKKGFTPNIGIMRTICFILSSVMFAQKFYNAIGNVEKFTYEIMVKSQEPLTVVMDSENRFPVLHPKPATTNEASVKRTIDIGSSEEESTKIIVKELFAKLNYEQLKDENISDILNELRTRWIAG